MSCIDVTYFIDGSKKSNTFQNIGGYRTLLADLVAEAGNGHKVNIRIDRMTLSGFAMTELDSTVSLVTPDAAAAYTERKNMAGYDVTITYNSVTDTYDISTSDITQHQTNQHLWQCTEDDYAVRFMFWTDSTMYVEIEGGEDKDFLGLRETFCSYRIDHIEDYPDPSSDDPDDSAVIYDNLLMYLSNGSIIGLYAFDLSSSELHYLLIADITIYAVLGYCSNCVIYLDMNILF
ncbi:MAG: hypothetical protein K5650_02070 [Bacteroidales bacterium]|nr:hypothetical protein [Bacteroidales bacterium]